MGFTVEDVMNSTTITVDAAITAEQAAKTMAQRGVSGLGVVSKKKLTGFITESDLITRVMALGFSPEKVKLMDIMSPPYTTVRPDSPLELVVHNMLLQGITELPVLGGEGGDEMVGVLSLSYGALLYPGLYATLVQLQEEQSHPEGSGTAFYIC